VIICNTEDTVFKVDRERYTVKAPVAG